MDMLDDAAFVKQRSPRPTIVLRIAQRCANVGVILCTDKGRIVVNDHLLRARVFDESTPYGLQAMFRGRSPTGQW